MTEIRDERVLPFVGKKIPWNERMDMIQKTFGDAQTFDFVTPWGPGDEITDIFAAIMRDILKVDQAVPGRPGPRPSLDREKALESLHRFMGRDYCTLPFPEAFRLLSDRQSLTAVARKTSLSRSQVYRLYRGEIQPDVQMMSQVAGAYKKHPSFFLEYRTIYVLAHLQQNLLSVPEATIDYYRKISRA